MTQPNKCQTCDQLPVVEILGDAGHVNVVYCVMCTCGAGAVGEREEGAIDAWNTLQWCQCHGDSATHPLEA